jgi:endo-1,4-beta-xylanase
MGRLALPLLLVAIAAARVSLAEEKLPVEGRAVFDAGKLSAFRLAGRGSKADISVVSVAGQPFSRAFRVHVAAKLPKAWDVQILTPPSTVPLKKGEHVLATLCARCVESPEGVGGFAAFIQAGGSKWIGIGSTDVIAGKEWTRIYIHARAAQDFGAGEYELTLHLGSQIQTLEIGGIAMLNLGPNVDAGKLPCTPIRYAGQEPDAPWRAAAAARIEKHRKGDLTVRVADRDGKPVAGAKVHVRMQRHAYGFGTFLEYDGITGSGPDAEKLRAWTLKMFNRSTTPIYWADWGWANPWIRRRYLACAKWAADNKLTTRGHCIIYPGWAFLPGFVKPLAKDPPALRKRLLEQVVEVTEATKQFHFSEYDVTNELRVLTEITDILGKDAVAEWFKVARQHVRAGTRLAINENTILTHGSATSAEQDVYAQWITYLNNRGQGPDVIGMQGHFGSTVTPPETVVRILDRFARFGKPIQVTEFDLPTADEKGQAQYTRDFLTAVFSHPSTEAFTMWGFWEGKMWNPPGALIRKDWTVKPNGQAWMDLVLKQWWTDGTAVTGRDGSCTTRGFLGDYKVTVTVGGKEKSAFLQLAAPAARTVLVLD